MKKSRPMPMPRNGTSPQCFSPSNDTMLTTVTRRRTIDEANTFNSAQYAPIRGEWKTFEAHRESARLDTERCQCSLGGRGLKAVGICLPGFSRFTGRQTGLYPRKHVSDMGSHVTSSKLQSKYQGRGQASKLARSEGSSCS